MLLVVLVIGIPLAIAGAVTLWSLRQVRYRPTKRRLPAARNDGAPDSPIAGVDRDPV